MRFSTIAATAALVAGTQASYAYNSSAPAYVTEVVTAYTTYCPGPTEISHSGVTYTVTEATTLTITNCPCTITKPVSSAVVTSCSTSTAPAAYSTPSAAESSPVAPVYSSGAPAPYSNATTPVVVPSSTGAYGTGSATTSAYATFTGAANKAFTASGAGLAAVFGLAAYVL